MSAEVIIGRDTGDETQEVSSNLPVSGTTQVQRLYAQLTERHHSVFAAQQGELFGDGDGGVNPQQISKPGLPSIGKMIDDAKKKSPHPLSPIIGPLIEGVINHKKAQKPTCTVPPGSSPPLTPPPAKSDQQQKDEDWLETRDRADKSKRAGAAIRAREKKARRNRFKAGG